MVNHATHGASKVPEVTMTFWSIKVAATTLGETAGDAVSMSMGLGYLAGTAVFACLFLLAVTWQIRAKQFHPAAYWASIVASTTVGTTLADFTDRSLGVGYAGVRRSSSFLLVASLATWYRSLGSISIYSIDSWRSESFYWITIMFSQTLGTALGDWTADTAGIGYAGGVLVFGALLGLVIAAYSLDEHLAHPDLLGRFVLTRPLGAVVGDLLDKPISAGGLALSRYTASGALLLFIVVAILVFPQRAAVDPA
jgi:uncharacterized membrane-anchored protein